MVKEQYAVIGLGRFGTSVAQKLYDAGQDVMGIDINGERVEDADSIVTHAVTADSTDEDALKSLGIRNFDCVIIAIGNDMQSSILTAMLLKDLGVKKVIAKALSRIHGKVLDKIGVDWVIYPERDMGERVAHQLLSPNVLSFIELSDEYHIEEIKVSPSFVDKNLRELDLRAKYNISALAIVSNGEIIVSPSPEQKIHKGDILVVIGNTEDLAEFASVK
ncbi:potassium channel family protein [Pseudoneobacillus sp. C159]